MYFRVGIQQQQLGHFTLARGYFRRQAGQILVGSSIS
jgi:hypothetical protein